MNFLMIQLGANNQNDQFYKEILGQLVFIKQHLRYPITRRILRPALSLGLMLPCFAFLLYHLISAKSNSHYNMKWFGPMLACSIMSVPIIAAYRYFQTLRFVVVPAHRSLGENMFLMQQFLQENHFAFMRHPQAPEVFMMMSKSIDGPDGAREIVVFIADDRRILINSHFTQNFRSSRWRGMTPIGSTHYKEMAKMLTVWLGTKSNLSPESSALF